MFHLGGVIGVDVCGNACLLDLSFCNLNGARGEVETFCLPACVGKGDDVGACAAANIQGTSDGVRGDEVVEFRRADAAIPGGVAEQV